MPLFIPARLGDVFNTFALLLTQLALFRFLLRDWKPRVSADGWRATLIAINFVWVLCGVATLLPIYAFRSSDEWVAGLRRTTVAIEMIYGLIASLAVGVYALYRSVADRLGPRVSATRRSLLRGSAAVLMAAPAAAIGYGAFIERKRFHVKEVDFPVPGLHHDLAGLRIVQISDLHVSAYLSVSDTGRIVDMANELRPDLAFITGDIISDFGDPLEEAVRELGRLRATAGVLGCHGNHEIYARCQNRTSFFCAKQGIQILRGQARQLRFGEGTLNVSGVDYQSIGHPERYLIGAERLVQPGASNILLSHSPDVFPTAVRKGFDAVLSGHTHAGQVTVEYLNRTLNIARFFTPYVAGLYRMDGRSCYVTAGLGTIGMPVRLGAEPELTLLRLRPA